MTQDGELCFLFDLALGSIEIIADVDILDLLAPYANDMVMIMFNGS